MLTILSLLLGIVVGAAGFVLGWWLKHMLNNSSEEQSQQQAKLDRRQRELGELIERLKALAENIAFDVEEHTESMQEANAHLREEAGDDSEAVIRVIARVIETNEALQRRLETAEDRLFEQAQAIESQAHEANTDALTGIANRRVFDKNLQASFERFERTAEPLSVMMLDVDYFKKFNDTHGHQAGDEVLKAVARTLKRRVKRNGLVCRYGGEEFAVLFPGCHVNECKDWAEQARATIAETAVDFKGRRLQVTASAGLAELRAGESNEQLVKRADEALYQAKASGRNQAFWNDGQHNHVVTVSVTQSLGQTAQKLQRGWSSDMLDDASFMEMLQRRIAEWRRGGACVSVGVLSVDHWNTLTQRYGNQVADLVLKATSQFLRASVRDMDNVALVEEGQFAVMFPNAKLDNLEKIGERLRSAISRCEIPTEHGKLNFTVSFGVAQAANEDDAKVLRTRGEEAARAAMKAGGNLCFSHNGDSLRQVTRPEPTPQR